MTKQESATLAALADELGDLEKDLAPWKAKAARADALRSSLRQAHRGSPASAICRIVGKKWAVTLGFPANESRVDIGALFRKLPANKFLDVVSVTLSALEKNAVSPSVVASVVSVTQTGPRPLTITPAG